MKNYLFSLPLAIAFFLITVSPQLASAHGHASFEINEKVYSFTVGSLNEPIAVDDKTGLDLRVESTTYKEHERAEATGVKQKGTPAEGLNATLKVELLAGDKKKTLDISPAFGVPGSYKAYFIPTVQTTFTYRLFGTIDNVPFNYTFTCNPAGHPKAEEDKTEVEVSPGIKRIKTAGSFGCPIARADLGFPEQSMTTYDLNTKIDTGISETKTATARSVSLGTIGIVVGVLGLIVGAGSLLRRRTH